MNAAFINTFATLLLIILYSIPMISLKEEPDLTENESTRGQEDGEIDIDEAGGYFDLLEGEDLPFSKRSFAINFLNRQQDYAVVEPKEGCARGTELFVFVPSRPQAFYLRQKIRESWASNLTDQRIELRFVVGWSSFQEDFDLLLQEFLHLDDLILYDIDDTYANLYMKIYVALQWQQFYSPSVPFVLKTDDDTVVDLGRLRWWIDNDFLRRTAQYSAAVFGGLWRGARPIRSQGHKWFVSRQDFSASTYPAYMNGPSYLLTGRAVSVILNATADVKAIPIEDILYTGILANRAHLRKFSIWQHFRRGKYIYVNERCKVDKASGRRVPYVTAIYGLSDPDKLQRAYDQLHRINCTAWSSAIGSIWNSLFAE